MATKIKVKKQPKPSNEGKIILIGTGCILGAIFILLVVLVIVQNVGKKDEDNTSKTESSTVSVTESSTESAASTVSSDEGSEVSPELLDPEFLKDVQIDKTKIYYADIDVKDYGKMTVELNYNVAPLTVRNFVYLAQSGFYNGLTFHRIMDGFMIQGGSPDGTGTGGSEHSIYGEFSQNGYEGNTLSHTKGVISMARNAIDMNSADSQFFIVQSDSKTAALDGKYAAFGKVIEGIEIVDAIAHDAKPTDNNGTIPADQQPIINSITIRTTDIIT